jgi:translation elongation factor EF-Ts
MPYKNNIGLQGSIVELSADPEITDEQNEEIVNEFADNIATQILGSPPRYISFEEIPEDVIEAETAKASAEMAVPLSKAPEQARPNIIAGKLFSNFYSKTLLGCMPYLLSNEGAQVSQVWEEV